MAKNTNKGGKGTNKSSKVQGEELFSLNDEAPTAPQGNGSASKSVKKTGEQISRGDFLTHAKAQAVRIGDTMVVAEVKQFSTGSLGWSFNGKVTIMVNGEPIKVQVGLNCTVVGSKPTE